MVGSVQAHRDGAPLPHWSPDEAKLFFNAYGKYNSPKGVLWEKVRNLLPLQDPCSWECGRLKAHGTSPCHLLPSVNIQVLQVARVIGTKTPDDCQALYSRFKSYLSLPKGIQHQVAFLAMVKDMVESESKVGASCLLKLPLPYSARAGQQLTLQGHTTQLEW